MSIKELFKIGLIKLSTVCLTILVLIVIFPALLCAYVPVHLYRFLISRISRIFRPDLTKILDPHSATYAATGSETNVVLYLKLQGQPDFERLKWSFFKKVILATANKDTRELLYPEFQQYIEIWCGFPFWKDDKQFSLSNHISNKEYALESDLNMLETELLRTPCKKSQSPWELIICEKMNSINSEEFTIFFKFHHSLADGYSIFNALMNWADDTTTISAGTGTTVPDPQQRQPTEATKKLSLIEKIKKYYHIVMFPLSASYDIAKVSLEQLLAGKLWENFKRQNKSELRVYRKSKSMGTKNLKTICTASKIHFSAVLVATIIVALKKFLRKLGNNDVPDYVVCPTPLPKNRAASTGLQNSFTIGSLNLPLGTEGKFELLRHCDHNFHETKTSTYGITASYMLQFIGKLPLIFLTIGKPAMMEPVFFSNFAGPRNLLSLDGYSVLDMSFSVNFSKCNPMVFTLLTYNGRMRIVLNVDSNLFENESSVTDLMCYLEDEFVGI